MAELQRITTQYVETEDRLRLAGENADGEALVLWLTQRLINRLLPHLCAWLERQTPVDDTHVYGAAVQAELIQSFAQQAAVVALAPQTPVRSTAQSRSWLVHAVDVTTGDQAVTLTFKDTAATGGAPATLTLADLPLRQWLTILHDQYAAAQWPLTVWPAWALDAPSPARQAIPAVLH